MRSRILVFLLLGALTTLIIRIYPVSKKPLIRIVGDDGKYGCVNSRGRLVVEPKWDYMLPFERHGLAIVFRGEKMGAVSRHGEEIVPPIWDDIGNFDSGRMAPVISSQKLGWIDKDGDIVIPAVWFPVFRSVVRLRASREGRFDSYGLCKVRNNEDMIGCIERSGKIRIKPEWSHIGTFDTGGMAHIVRDGKWGWIHQSGEIRIPPKWSNALDFDLNGMAPIKSEERWGWIKRDGRIVIKLIWDKVQVFDKGGMAGVERNGSWGWIDRQGAIKINLEWDDIGEFDDEGFAPVKKGGKWGWVNREGDLVISSSWDAVRAFDSKGWAMVSRDGRNGWIDRSGKIIVPPEWEMTSQFDSQGRAIIVKGGPTGWINENGYPHPFQVLDGGNLDPNDPFNQLHGIKEIGKWGAMKRSGEVIVKPIWDRVTFFDHFGIASVCKSEKWGAVDSSGKIVIPPRWERELKFSENGLAFVYSGVHGLDREGWGNWVDFTGQQILPPEHLGRRFDFNQRALVKNRKTTNRFEVTGWVDTKGKMVIDPTGDGWNLLHPRLNSLQEIRSIFRQVDYLDDCESDEFRFGSYSLMKESEAGLDLFRKVGRWFFQEREQNVWLCHLYDKNGKLIWSNAWLRFESKCMIVFTGFCVCIGIKFLIGFRMRKQGDFCQ